MKHKFEYVVIRLSKKNNHLNVFDLKFKLCNNNFVAKWINCVLLAQQLQYPISEPWAFYNLNDRMNKELLVTKINDLITEINSYEKLFDCKLDDIHDQDTLNKIHSIFEKHHGQLDEWLTNPLFENKPKHFRNLLSQINQFVHLCESHDTTTKKIRIVWFDLPKINTFDDADYKLFTDARKFGTLYTLYSDVGKNLEALAMDNDKHHHDIVPNLHYSADCNILFNTETDIELKQRKQKYKEYAQQNKHYLETKGYSENDIRLTTGHIPLASLETDLNEKEILSHLRNFDNIQSVNLI